MFSIIPKLISWMQSLQNEYFSFSKEKKKMLSHLYVVILIVNNCISLITNSMNCLHLFSLSGSTLNLWRTFCWRRIPTFRAAILNFRFFFKFRLESINLSSFMRQLSENSEKTITYATDSFKILGYVVIVFISQIKRNRHKGAFYVHHYGKGPKCRREKIALFWYHR